MLCLARECADVFPQGKGFFLQGKGFCPRPLQLLLQLLLQNTALQLRCRMPLLLGAAQSCLSNAGLHLALHNRLGLHLHFCTLPSTIARDCSCTLCSCTLHFDTCDVPKRGRERDGNAGEEERKEMPGCPFLQPKKKQLLCYKRENKTFGPICICKNGFVDIGPQRRIFTP